MGLSEGWRLCLHLLLFFIFLTVNPVSVKQLSPTLPSMATILFLLFSPRLCAATVSAFQNQLVIRSGLGSFGDDQGGEVAAEQVADAGFADGFARTPGDGLAVG